MTDRPNTTCDHYGCDRATLRPTCTKGRLTDFASARRAGCIRGHGPKTGSCTLRDDSGQEARDAEVERVCDAVMAGRCPDCGGELERTETSHNVFQRCPTCPDVSVIGCKRAGCQAANEPPDDGELPLDPRGDTTF